MFKRITILSFILIVLTGIATYWTVIRSRPQDLAFYKKLIEESVSLKMRGALQRLGAHQVRRGVQKDIWTLSEGSRLHFRLHSAKSHLVLTQKKDKVEALENLEDVDCVIQEKIDLSRHIQHVRTLKAPRGTYMYPPHQFDLDDTSFHFFKLPGEKLPEKISEAPFLKAQAEKVTFQAVEKNPHLTAYQVQAQLFGEANP